MVNIVGRLAGAGGKLLRDLKYELVGVFLAAELISAIQDYLTTGRIELEPIPDGVAGLIAGPVGEAERVIGQPLFELLVRAPSGAQLSREPGSQEANAVAMVERLLGFAIALPWGISKLKSALVAAMGENAAKGLVEALEKVPEEIGINWALGNVLDRILETAAGRPIEEAIMEQSRPSRVEWPQLRALFRAHSLNAEQLRERLSKAGWRDEDQPLLASLDRTRLTIGDLQQAYVFGLRDEQWVRDYLGQIGVDGEDADLAIELYLKRAETAGGDQLRAVAQRGYLDGRLSEDQYVAILREVKVPEPSIQLEVAAARLVKEWGQKQLSVAEVKKLHADNIIDDGQARVRMIELGYTENDAMALIADWKIEKRVAHSGLTENRILSYLVSGVLTPTEAYDRLLGLGIRAEDASFLIAHPEAARVIKSHGASDATIVAALEDDIIDAPTAVAKLVATGMDEAGAQLTIDVAHYKMVRGKKTRQAPKSLSEAHIITAFQDGLATSAWAVRELVTIGYNEADALLIMAEEEVKLSKVIPDGWVTLT